MISEEEKTRRMLAHMEEKCERTKNESLRYAKDYSGWCEVVWDNVMCWNNTRPGTVARLPCPSYITRFTITEYAERICTENGTWWFSQAHNSSWTNFSKCVIPPLDISSHAEQANNLILLYTVGYSISLISLIVAVVIMLYWRRLRCKSTILHINLFMAFILRASMSFMKDRLFVNGLGLPHDVRAGQTGLEFIQEGIHWECRVLFVLLMFAISSSQTWMLMEALYLHLLVHKTMTAERLGATPYIVLGWALPWSFLVPWIVIKSTFENTYCWNMQENPAYFWIMKGPWTAIVVVNFIFFLDIIRVLTTRVMNNQRHASRSQYRKFGKFILVLIPLFGIMYIVLNVAFPSEVQGLEYNVIYLYIEMGYNSFQGFILALLFCFLNEDTVTAGVESLLAKHRSESSGSDDDVTGAGSGEVDVDGLERAPVDNAVLANLRAAFCRNEPMSACSTALQVHSEIRRSVLRHRSQRLNSSTLKRSENHRLWRISFRQSGAKTPPENTNDSSTARGNTDGCKVKASKLHDPFSAYSSYKMATAVPLGREASHSVKLLTLGNTGCNNNFRENFSMDITVL